MTTASLIRTKTMSWYVMYDWVHHSIYTLFGIQSFLGRTEISLMSMTGDGRPLFFWVAHSGVLQSGPARWTALHRVEGKRQSCLHDGPCRTVIHRKPVCELAFAKLEFGQVLRQYMNITSIHKVPQVPLVVDCIYRKVTVLSIVPCSY